MSAQFTAKKKRPRSYPTAWARTKVPARTWPLSPSSAALVASNERADLRRREADIAVRHVRPEGDDLIARLLMERSEAHLYGAPAYLKALGRPKTPAALATSAAQIFGFEDNPRLLQMMQSAGYPVTEDNLVYAVNDHLVQWELARKGLGLCVMMSEIGDHDDAVVRAVKGAAPVITLPTWLTTHRELRSSRRMRVVFDAIAAALGQDRASRTSRIRSTSATA